MLWSQGLHIGRQEQEGQREAGCTNHSGCMSCSSRSDVVDTVEMLRDDYLNTGLKLPGIK